MVSLQITKSGRGGEGGGSLTYMLSISAAFMTRFEMRNVLCH